MQSDKVLKLALGLCTFFFCKVTGSAIQPHGDKIRSQTLLPDLVLLSVVDLGSCDTSFRSISLLQGEMIPEVRVLEFYFFYPDNNTMLEGTVVMIPLLRDSVCSARNHAKMMFH